MRKRPPHRSASRNVGSGEAGFSLLEALFSSVLVLVIAVSILPLFMRALESNTAGGRSSQISTLVIGQIEENNQGLVDRPDWQLTGAAVSALSLPTRFWDTGRVYHDDLVRDQLGDEKWIDAADTPEGPLMWASNITVRKYTFADVHIGLDVSGSLSVIGHPQLFDTPLRTDSGGRIHNSHFTELTMSIVESRAWDSDDGLVYAAFLGKGQRITIGHLRAY